METKTVMGRGKHLTGKKVFHNGKTWMLGKSCVCVNEVKCYQVNLFFCACLLWLVNECMEVCMHYSRATWTCFILFWVHVIWVPKLKISVCMCGRKIWVLCKLFWLLATVQKFHLEALKTLKTIWFSVLREWTIEGLSIWTLPGGSQLPMHPGY